MMIKPKPWERVMKVHKWDEWNGNLCGIYAYKALSSDDPRKVTCRKCLRLLEAKGN